MFCLLDCKVHIQYDQVNEINLFSQNKNTRWHTLNGRNTSYRYEANLKKKHDITLILNLNILNSSCSFPAAAGKEL